MCTRVSVLQIVAVAVVAVVVVVVVDGDGGSGSCDTCSTRYVQGLIFYPKIGFMPRLDLRLIKRRCSLASPS